MMGGRYYHLPSESPDAFLDKYRPTDVVLLATFIQAFAPGFKADRARTRMQVVYTNKEAYQGVSQTELDERLEKTLALAKEANITLGKWMLRIDGIHVDAFWRRLVVATLKGDLGPVSIKCSTKAAADKHPRHPGMYTICVYVTDGILNRPLTMDVYARLERSVDLSLVAISPIYFKPDLFTHLGISAWVWQA